MKQCKKCQVMKPLDEFHKSSRIKSGYISSCKACETIRHKKKYDPKKNKARYDTNKQIYLAKQKAYYQNNIDAIKKRSKTYYENNSTKWLETGWKQKGILNKEGAFFSMTDYKLELERVNNKCEICNSDGSLHKKGLCVDHDHSTGLVRGILCGHCNSGLGHFHDDSNKLSKAIKYLNKNNEM